MAATFVAVFLSLLALGWCGQYTVTDEVFFDIKISDLDGPGRDFQGRLVIAVFGETAPMTTLNFVSIARGYAGRGTTLSYKNTPVHRLVPDFVVQMGDITQGDGTGGVSIFGENFNDEQFILSHRSPGWVAMANHGPDTNGSQFYILLNKARWLDGKHVVFGKVIQGYNILDTLNDMERDPQTAMPLKKIMITDCGVRPLDKKYDMDHDQLDLTEDL